MKSVVYLRMVFGCVGIMLSSIALADVVGSEPDGEGNQASFEWKTAENAVRDGDKKLLIDVIESHQGFVNKVVDDYFTLLGIAAGEGDYELVEELVESGADPDIANGSALYKAMPGTLKPHSKEEIEKRLKIVLYLIQQGASLNHETPISNTGVSLAEAYIMGVCDKGNNPEYATDFLRRHGFEYSVIPLFRANYVHIANLTKEEFGQYGKDRECVDFMFRATGGKGVSPYDDPVLIYKVQEPGKWSMP